MTFKQLMDYGMLAFKNATVQDDGKMTYPIGVMVLCVGLCMVIGYLLGSLNFGVIISRIYGEDIRKKGSGNAGATNMMRVYGKKASILTLTCDALKTIVAVYIGRLLIMGYLGAYITGLFAIIGHAWPIYFGFKGGKGVAAISAFCLVTEPIIFLIELVIFIIILFGFKMVSLGSVMIALIYPFILAKITGFGPHVLVGMLCAVLVIFLHRKNIVRIYNHTENKFKLDFKKKKKNTEEESAIDEVSKSTEESEDKVEEKIDEEDKK